MIHSFISPHKFVCSQIDLAYAILLAADHGADVINVSGGEFTPSGMAHPVLADAIRHCVRRGILIVAAAGNDGCDCLHIPAAVSGVLAVGAMTLDGEPLPSSNWGSHYRQAGLLAPGANLLTAISADGVAAASGTSFAAAIVSGIVGILLSLARIQTTSMRMDRRSDSFYLTLLANVLMIPCRCRQTLAGPARPCAGCLAPIHESRFHV